MKTENEKSEEMSSDIQRPENETQLIKQARMYKANRRAKENTITSSWIHGIRGEDDAVMSHQDDWPALHVVRLWRQAPNDLRASHLHVRRRVRTEEHRNRISLREVLAVDGEHLRGVRIGFSQYRSRSRAVRLWSLRGAVGRKILYDARERRDRLRGYRE